MTCGENPSSVTCRYLLTEDGSVRIESHIVETGDQLRIVRSTEDWYTAIRIGREGENSFLIGRATLLLGGGCARYVFN